MISVEIIDFTNAEHRRKSYGGANGKKISVIYNNELYMLKFPSFAKQNKDMSYSNSCFSEYLGCKIFESIGIPAQKTLIGTYKSKDKEKIVVACHDFTRPGIVLQDFASFKNQIIDSENNGYGTELKYILETFENQSILDPIKLQEHFWDMFIVDALIGNWDRHNGNWGFLYNAETDEVSLAPIYDCGSSLYPQADVDIMKKTLTDGNEMDLRIFDIPTSAIRVNNNRIRYYDFISSLANKECNKALLKILPKISLNEIGRIIDETPFISDLQKNFYKTMIGERKTRILDYSSDLLKEREVIIGKHIENKNFYDA